MKATEKKNDKFF